MSKISIKTDFQDGEKLFAADLNNNFRVIQAGVNANEENLELIIQQAIVRLDAELQAILDQHNWTWSTGEDVSFFKGTTEQIEDLDILNGQMIYNTETGETALDTDNERLITGSGNVVAVTDTEPDNPATKLWINPDEVISSLGTEVVNSMAGNQTNMAPSVSAAKSYSNGLVLNTMSGTETDKAPSVSAVKGYVPSNANIVDLIYPVGSIYMSYNSTSPVTLFGGTWTKLENCFLYASGTKSVGSTGGSETVTLTVDQMPSHTHKSSSYKSENGASGNVTATPVGYTNPGKSGDYTSTATGGGEAHNNMPPYLVVNMWRRTA